MTDDAVVIVRRGPAGLTLAGELALAHVDVAIVERHASQDLAASRTVVCTHVRSRFSISAESPIGSYRRGRWRRSRGSPGSRWTSAIFRAGTITSSGCGRSTSSVILIFASPQAKAVFEGCLNIMASESENLTAQIGFAGGPDGAPVLMIVPTGDWATKTWIARRVAFWPVIGEWAGGRSTDRATLPGDQASAGPA
jgi:hypothetical protein